MRRERLPQERSTHFIVYEVKSVIDGHRSAVAAEIRIHGDEPSPFQARVISDLVEQNKVDPLQSLVIDGVRHEQGVPLVPNPFYEAFMERVRKMAQVNKPKEFPPF